ncbi:MAG: hypothetical protein GXY03_15995 [Solirubrobacterales bacterium]|nr:hypothetical protein [Solirubrobacterales bacterium]
MNPRDLIEAIRASPATQFVIVTSIALQAFFLVAHGVNKELLGDGLFLALDSDPNLPSWTTSAIFLLAGVACGLLAWLRPELRAVLAALAAITLFVSLEQTAQLHTQLEHELADPGASLIQAAIGLCFAAVIVVVAVRTHGLTRVLLVGALLAAAISFGGSAMNRAFDLPYALLIFFQTIEELGELSTGTLILAAVVQPLIDAVGGRLETPGAV